MTMKYKVGDRVQIKRLDWHNEYKDMNGNVFCGCEQIFNPCTALHCGQVLTIKHINCLGWYEVEEEAVFIKDGMIEGLAEEETLIERVDDKGLPFNEWLSHKGAFHIPDGYELKDENGNVINATKIVLEKKKKEYPKTYEECAKIMNCPIDGPSGWLFNFDVNIKDSYYRKIDILMGKFTRLLICRDAYWKIAGEEMGLGKPWKPNDSSGYCTYAILRHTGHIRKSRPCADSALFEFPTEEMRDAFKENFDPDIEICKEFL